jgi:hypothetical protein
MLQNVEAAIELEASYQVWRAQHERYWFLSRRAWLDSDRLDGFRTIASANEAAPRTAKSSTS